MSTSTVPAVLDALVALARAVLTPERVQVLDGGPHRDTEPDVVAIGFTGDPGEACVTDTRTRERTARAVKSGAADLAVLLTDSPAFLAAAERG